MIPKTRLQKEVWALSLELPPLTLKQAILLRQRIIRDGADGFLRNGTLRCMVCGHVTENYSSSNGDNRCPCCGYRIDVKESRRVVSHDDPQYAALSMEYKGWQVTRTYTVSKDTERNCPTEYNYFLVQECWDSPRGRVFLQRSRAMNYYFAKEGRGWGPNMEIRSEMSWNQLNPNLEIVESVIPELKKRGYVKNRNHDMYLTFVFGNLLRNNLFESYWKRKMYIAAYCITKSGIESIIPSIKIFLRHRQEWRSCEEFREWEDMIRILESLGKDIRNPFYICPENIHEAHDRYLDKLNKIKAEKRRVEMEKRAAEAEAKYAEERVAVFGNLEIKGEGLIAKMLPDVKSFIEEANAMHHCVFHAGYYDVKSHPDSLILSVRDDKEWTHRVETVEVSLKSFTIIQSRGVCNKSTERHGDILKLINDNMDSIKKAWRSKKNNYEKHDDSLCGTAGNGAMCPDYVGQPAV